MGMFDPDEVITEYSIREALEMGALVEVFKDRWNDLSGGKPIVASANVFEFEGEDRLREIWNRFVFWQKHIMPKSEDGFFSTEIGVSKIWVFMTGCVSRYCIRRTIEEVLSFVVPAGCTCLESLRGHLREVSRVFFCASGGAILLYGPPAGVRGHPLS